MNANKTIKKIDKTQKLMNFLDKIMFIENLLRNTPSKDFHFKTKADTPKGIIFLTFVNSLLMLFLGTFLMMFHLPMLINALFVLLILSANLLSYFHITNILLIIVFGFICFINVLWVVYFAIKGINDYLRAKEIEKLDFNTFFKKIIMKEKLENLILSDGFIEQLSYQDRKKVSVFEDYTIVFDAYTISDLKKEYHEYVKLLHPDNDMINYWNNNNIHFNFEMIQDYYKKYYEYLTVMEKYALEIEKEYCIDYNNS